MITAILRFTFFSFKAARHDLDAHFYADDSQAYVFSTPAAVASSDTRLLARPDEMAEWM